MGDRAGALHLPAAGNGLNGDEAWVSFGPPAAEPEPLRNQRNHRITDANRLGVGSLKRKCQDNLAASARLQRLEAEGRAATDDEKRVLVRYVGWGGLPQVFDPWNEESKAERQRLEQILTPDELDSAGATTLNVHYTAPVILRTVYAALQRLANSVAEMFAMQRFLQMATLKAQNVAHFDAWAGVFGEPVTAMELAPDGSGYRLHARFARFLKVPELMQMFRQGADIQTQAMLKLPVPDLRGGIPTVISAPCSPELKQIVASLVERAEALRTGHVDPRDDHMLLVTTDGRKAALDLRLHDPHLPDHPDSKVNQAVATLERVWRKTAAERSAQLVFCDLSVPTGGRGFSVYEDMRDKLIARGVPAADIEFIQDHDSDAAELQLFRDVRAGKVRILLGSTQKMGTGANVQERLIALHHLDAPGVRGMSNNVRGASSARATRTPKSRFTVTTPKSLLTPTPGRSCGDQGPVHRPGDERRD